MAADSLQSCRRWAHCAPAAGTLSQIRPFPVFSVYFSLFFFYLIGRGQIPVALWNPEFVSKAVKIRAPFVIEGFFFFLPWNFKLHKAGLIFFFFFFFYHYYPSTQMPSDYHLEISHNYFYRPRGIEVTEGLLRGIWVLIPLKPLQIIHRWTH